MLGASFWLMSTDGVVDAVCVDVVDPKGDLINHKDNAGNCCYVAPAASYEDGEKQAVEYAARYGVDPANVFYDEDSTATFRS